MFQTTMFQSFLTTKFDQPDSFDIDIYWIKEKLRTLKINGELNYPVLDLQPTGSKELQHHQ